MVEDANLLPPVRLALWTAVQTNLAHIPSLGQQGLEQRQLPNAFVGELRMQAERRADAIMALGKRDRSTPCLWRRRYRQDVGSGLRAAAGDAVDEEPVPSTEGSGRTLLWPQPTPEVVRQYVVIPYSTRERSGAPSAPLGVPLVAAPPAPPAPAVTHDATAFTLAWTTPQGVQLPVQPTVTAESYKQALTTAPETALLPARAIVTYGTPQTYRVYQLPGPDAPASAATGPVNTVPLESPGFVDPRMEFGVPRCYAVRTVERRGAITIESPLSPATCVIATDTYPPPTPTGLVAVGSEGGVSLIWEPVAAPDLAGYLVLRGVEGDAALRPITSAPVVETTYRDTTTQAGVMYIYAVVAVDKATPANPSPESNRVRESAR